MVSGDRKDSIRQREVLRRIDAISRQVEAGHLTIEEGSQQGRALLDSLGERGESNAWIRSQLTSRLRIGRMIFMVSAIVLVGFIVYMGVAVFAGSAP